MTKINLYPKSVVCGLEILFYLRRYFDIRNIKHQPYPKSRTSIKSKVMSQLFSEGDLQTCDNMRSLALPHICSPPPPPRTVKPSYSPPPPHTHTHTTCLCVSYRGENFNVAYHL